MIEKTFRIKNKLGIHARPAGQLVKVATRFKSAIYISRNGNEVNAKSIMGVMMLAAGKGTTILIETEGDDEAEAMNDLVALINDKFGEGE